MSVVAPETLRDRVDRYVDRNPEATLPEVLGYFLLDPAENSDERAVVENTLAEARPPDADRDAADGEQGGASA
jgi:hypothetical protein